MKFRALALALWLAGGAAGAAAAAQAAPVSCR